MASANPVSPKVIAGGIASVVLPIVLYVLSELLNNLNVVEGLPTWAYPLAATLGAVVAGYVRSDPARVNTLPEAEEKLAELSAEVNL